MVFSNTFVAKNSDKNPARKWRKN